MPASLNIYLQRGSSCFEAPRKTEIALNRYFIGACSHAYNGRLMTNLSKFLIHSDITKITLITTMLLHVCFSGA